MARTFSCPTDIRHISKSQHTAENSSTGHVSKQAINSHACKREKTTISKSVSHQEAEGLGKKGKLFPL